MKTHRFIWKNDYTLMKLKNDLLVDFDNGLILNRTRGSKVWLSNWVSVDILDQPKNKSN